jgi:two-component system, response regulator PdtaR
MNGPHHLLCVINMPNVVTGRTGPVVLIVEDNLLQRQLAVEFARGAGFETLEADGADGALALLRSHSEIDVLFTDIDMPGSMNGLKLAFVVRDLWPAIEILIASGHARLSSSYLPPNGRFLRKPYGGPPMIAELHLLAGRAAPALQA